jgi:hypothetical protein
VAARAGASSSWRDVGCAGAKFVSVFRRQQQGCRWLDCQGWVGCGCEGGSNGGSDLRRDARREQSAHAALAFSCFQTMGVPLAVGVPAGGLCGVCCWQPCGCRRVESGTHLQAAPGWHAVQQNTHPAAAASVVCVASSHVCPACSRTAAVPVLVVAGLLAVKAGCCVGAC